MSLFSIAAKFALKGASKRVPEDIMSGTVRRIKQEAQLPETPSRVLGKDPERYTGPHSDFKRKEGLEAIEEVDVKSFQDKYFRGDDKTRYRSKDLEKKTRELDEGLITLDDFKKARDEIKPLKTYGTVPPLNKQVDEAGELIAPNKFDPIEIVGPIGKTRVDKSGIIGFNKFIKEGERSTSRFDIDAYNHYDRYIPVIETLVDKVSKATGKITKRFAKKGYSPTAVLTDVNFNYNPKKAFSIAKGETKAPFATMEGNWKNLTPEEAHRYAKEKVGTEGWTEVGFDPAARQSFYNRATGEPVFKADEVIQVGAMVLARGLKKATPKQLEKLKITTKAGKEITYKQGGQVSEGLSSIVSRAKGGKTKRKKKDKDFYADFDRKGKPTPELLNRISINKLMEDLEWERIPKEVKRKRREEAEQWEDMKFIQEAMKDAKKGEQMFMPNQDLYDNPIFKDVVTKRKGGGGLSNIKKSININGQPHSLAWINPDEASALKAMGGSGKKGPMGIPSYQTDEDYSWDWGDTGGYQYGEAEGFTGDDTTQEPTGYTQQELRDYAADLGTTVGGLGDIGTAKARQTYVDTVLEDPRFNVYKTKLLETGMGGEAMEAHMRSMGPAGLAKMIEKWETGYDFGGPMGTMEGISRDIGESYAKKLKLKKHLEKLEDLKGKKLPEEDMETRREELISAFRDHAKKIGGEFIPSTKFGGIMSGWEDTLKRAGKEDSLFHKGLGYLAPGALMTKVGAAGLNALTSAFGVVGEFITPEGKSFRVMDDGTLVAPDIYPDTDEGTVERKPIRKPPPLLAPPPEPLEKELTGMEKYIAERPKASSTQASLQHQFNILSDTYGRERAAALLNQPVNIFA